MILDAIIVVLTGSIAIAAMWMAIGLLRRRPDRIDKLSAIGLESTWWSVLFGLALVVAVIGLIIGWWIASIGLASIVAIKLGYFATLVAYRRKDKDRDSDHVAMLMSAHSLAAIIAIGLLIAS